jgi:hypothetical protein
LHDASITDSSLKAVDHLHFSNDGNYVLLPSISIGSNGFTFITTFLSDNSPSLDSAFNKNILVYISYHGFLYLNVSGLDLLLDANNYGDNTKRTVASEFRINNDIDFYVNGSFISRVQNAYPSAIVKDNNHTGYIG